MKNPKVSRRKEIIKIRVEINEKETKETIAKINKAKQTSHQPDSSRKKGRSIKQGSQSEREKHGIEKDGSD